MAKLLVSVRDSREALDALAGGADIIDIKEPNRGSLGRAEYGTILAIRKVVPNRVPLSMACGELIDGDLADPYPKLSFAKIGLSKCQDLAPHNASGSESWCDRWQRWMETLPQGTKPIAVVYADVALARSPAPLEIIRESQQLGCQGILVDTFRKHPAQSLLEQSSTRDVIRWITAARDGNQFIALAGSLTLESIPQIVRLGADIIAVRGAACADQRTGQICQRKVRHLATALSTPAWDSA